MKQMNENMKKIRCIEDKYGLVLFRMGLTHLCDVGVRHLDDESVEAGIRQIMDESEADKTSGKIPIMTPEFQCEILRCAAELSYFSIWTLFEYIKKYVVISN